MSTMDELIKEVNKKFKDEIVTVGLNEYDYKRIPFTSPRMNYITFGGLPVGKVIEFSGEEHGGKTTTTLDIIANFQHSDDDRKVLYVDAENTLDTVWATKLGVDLENMIIMQPKSQTAEQIFDFVCASVETGEIGFWVIDSLGALLSQQEFDKDIEDSTYGGISRPLTKFSKKVEMLNAKYKCTGIGINQMRDVIGAMFPTQNTPGGRAWKHLCMVRIEFRRGKFLDANGNDLSKNADNPAGNIVLVSMLKNKSCPPTRRVGQYTLNYCTGVDYLKDLVYVATQFDVIRQTGSWFDIADIETGEVLADKLHGLKSVYAKLEEDAELTGRIEQLIDNRITTIV